MRALADERRWRGRPLQRIIRSVRKTIPINWAAAAKLRVRPRRGKSPAIISQPAGQTVNRGRWTFATIAVGGAPFVPMVGVNSITVLPTATTPVHGGTNATAGNEGTQRNCTNDFGSATSQVGQPDDPDRALDHASAAEAGSFRLVPT